MKILFQGDSITDAGRDRSDYHNLAGYSTLVADMLKSKYPQENFEFINLGISGDRTIDLLNRYDTDFKQINPDIVSIMIGINDVWHYFADPLKFVGPDGYEHNYKSLLQKIKIDSNARILILEPYLLDSPDKLFWKKDLYAIIERCRSLAVTFADEYVPFDGLFAKACVKTPWQVFSSDGVHPSVKGEQLIADYYVEAISPIIDDIILKRK